jgi:hypothetical protein
MTTTISYRERFLGILGKSIEIKLNPGETTTLYVNGYLGLFRQISQSKPLLSRGVTEYTIKESRDGSGVRMSSLKNGQWYNPGKEEVTGEHKTSFGVTINHQKPKDL